MHTQPAETLPRDFSTGPNPLALTCAEYVAARARLEGRAASAAALSDYKRWYRGEVRGLGDWCQEPVRTVTTESPEGAVHKFLLGVPAELRSGPGGARVGATLETESVVIPMRRRHETTHTLCVSSQVGCAMGCGFCETAQMGLVRSLTAAEIVAQWWAATHHPGQEIRNIVFMGMGEPLDNLEQVIRAISILTDHHGASVPMRRITVSTVGRLDGLERLREQVQQPGWKPLNLAVSINAPNDAIRSAIMPINRAMPLGELVRVLRQWPMRKSGAICAEYVLIPGVNDAMEHADELVGLLRGLRCCVNVIPYNPRRQSPWPAPTEEQVAAFLARLEAGGQFCKRRRTKGRESMAACGQLGNEQVRNRRFVELGTSARPAPGDPD